jgi:hypothetical protein
MKLFMERADGGVEEAKIMVVQGRCCGADRIRPAGLTSNQEFSPVNHPWRQ